MVKHFLRLQGIRICWCKKCEPSTASHERTSSEKGWRIQHCSATLSVGTNGCSRFVVVICIEVQGTNELNNSQTLSHSVEKKRIFEAFIICTISAGQGYDGYGGYGDGNGAAYGGGISEMQQYEENIKELRRNNKLQRASHLARSADFMLNVVLDECPHCGSVANVVW